jgi:hypothetical protein
MPREAEDLTGVLYGTRKVISRAKNRKYGDYSVIYWNVLCVCGAQAEVQGSSLKNGAGCAKCASRARRGKSDSQPRKPARAAAVEGRSGMTVGELTKVLKGKDPAARVLLQLVSEEGFTVVDVKPPLATLPERLVLCARLPKEVHPWE